MSAFSELISAHALRFERPERAPYDAAAGTRLLVAFVLVGLVLHPALRALARAAGLAREPWVGPAIVVTLTLAVILAVRGLARLGIGAIGLHRWEAWTPRERIYVWTVVPLAAAVFAIVFREQFARLAETRGWVRLLALTVPTGLLWGMVQEFIYRGLLQTELVRRLGGVFGVLLANLVFTFGPLHFNYFGLGAAAGPRWSMFAAIFGIGLFFGILYRRSGNLWIPALLHGMWPLNMT
jgi:membrane protease YdiL (CAAX protease family)